MRKQPYDLLSQEDIDAYCAYLETALKCGEVDAPHSLAVWNKNKKTLLKALGGKLRHSIHFEMKKPLVEVNQLFRRKYPNRYPCSKSEWNEVYRRRRSYDDDFPFLFMDYLVQDELVDDEELKQIARIFEHDNIRVGYIEKHEFENKTILGIKLKGGEKTIKLIGKLVKKSKFPNMTAFEEWRNQMSDITTSINMKAKLVISIHPLDFLSLSDNNSSWDSCYRLLGGGMHKEATITHMNSNCAVVAYIESKTPFEVAGHRIPNKNFRQLFYVHKDIICGGRSYPFGDDHLTKQIIDILQELVYNNLKWKYQYSYQEYKDMLPINSNSDIVNPRGRSWYIPDYGNHIYLYLGHKSGYNDIIEHKDEDFYCVRNWVPNNKYIKVTGPLTCVKCGRQHGAVDYNASTLICDDHRFDEEEV